MKFEDVEIGTFLYSKERDNTIGYVVDKSKVYVTLIFFDYTFSWGGTTQDEDDLEDMVDVRENNDLMQRTIKEVFEFYG